MKKKDKQLDGFEERQAERDRRAQLKRERRVENVKTATRISQDITLDAVQLSDPQLHAFSTNASHLITVNKVEYSLKCNRAIWYLGLDKNHSFDPRDINTRANFSFVRTAFLQD